MKKMQGLRPNTPGPTLFVGVGGRGSDIINGVAELAENDSLENVRFIIFDTDVNDLNDDKNSKLLGVQISSTKTVEAYLTDDKNSRNWFPSNEAINRKTVSEGAGQVRAISRLALNATIKEGRINILYRLIDELYLKNGCDKKQAIKIIIASTAAGGTGSGIAMMIGMLIKKYLQKNYPESAAIIRGFFLLPGVCQTFNPAQSETASLHSNGYATIKEINAFMMKGGGYFETDGELRRYRNLHITIPSATYGVERLDNLPFDFCFLMDRTDANQGNMNRISQYVEQAARSIYEQTIGPMRNTAASKEDNIHKVFNDPDKRGTSRFGGMGASAIVYPYEKIIKYVALNEAQKTILGRSFSAKISDEDAKTILENSWLVYDNKFSEEFEDWRDKQFGIGQEPLIEERFVSYIQGEDAGVFTRGLREKYLDRKLVSINVVNDNDDEDENETNMPQPEMTDDDERELKSEYDEIINDYMNKIAAEVVSRLLTIEGIDNDILNRMSKAPERRKLSRRYKDIYKMETIINNGAIPRVAESFTKSIIQNPDSFAVASHESTSIESLLSINGRVLHPIIARYLLYKLKLCVNHLCKTEPDFSAFQNSISDIVSGRKGDKKKYAVGLFAQEKTLEEMCNALVDNQYSKFSSKVYDKCLDYLDQYKSAVNDFLEENILYYVGKTMSVHLEPLIKKYERFFMSLNSKIPSVERKKLTIAEDLHFDGGDNVVKLFGSKKRYGKENITESKKILDELCVFLKGTSISDESSLYECIFNAIKASLVQEQKAERNAYEKINVPDIFDDIILEHYAKSVAEYHKDELDKPLLQMLVLEHQITNKVRGRSIERSKYVKTRLKQAELLAAPGISKNDFGESREINAVTCSNEQMDGEGIKVTDFLADPIYSNTVSKYEIRFFKSVYDIMPTQLTKFCYPASIENVEELIDSINSDSAENLGEYFRSYQQYMKTVRSNSELNSSITPHIDKRWNSISVLPEIDLNYQRALMSHIHQALLYGFLYNRIIKVTKSTVNDSEVYRYVNDGEEKQDLYVSNGTECDQFYEVLDALYFDRAAVTAIHNYAKKERNDKSKDGISYSETSFAIEIEKLKRKQLIGDSKIATEPDSGESVISVFEIPVLYYNSLPSELRDDFEIKTMVGAIIQVFKTEIAKVTDECDVMPTLSKIIIEQFNLLVKNYIKYPLTIGKYESNTIENSEIVDDIYRQVKKAVNNFEGDNKLIVIADLTAEEKEKLKKS